MPDPSKTSPSAPAPTSPPPSTTKGWAVVAAACIAVVMIVIGLNKFGEEPNAPETDDVAVEDVHAHEVADAAPASGADVPEDAGDEVADADPTPVIHLEVEPNPVQASDAASTRTTKTESVTVTTQLSKPTDPVTAPAAAPKTATVANPPAATVATAKPPPAPKVALPKTVVSAMGLKPACKAECSWDNVDPADGFPRTVNGKRSIKCGETVYEVASWTKITEGPDRFCYTVTGDAK